MRRGNFAIVLAFCTALGVLVSGCTQSTSDQETAPIGAPGDVETSVPGTPTPPQLLFTPLPPKNERTPIPTPRGKTPAAKPDTKPDQKQPTSTPKPDNKPDQKQPTSTPKPSATPVPTATKAQSPKPSSAVSPTQTAKEVKVTIREDSIGPGNIAVETGRVILTIENKGTALHSLLIKGIGVDTRTDRVEAGRSVTKEITFTQPGTYEISCPVDDHKQRGETGTITVK